MNLFVMAGLVPAIHTLAHKTWMRGSSPRMTVFKTHTMDQNAQKRQG